MLNTSYKKTATALILFSYLFLSCLVSVLPATGRLRREMRIRLTSLFSRSALRVLGVRVRVSGVITAQSDYGGRLIVSNHLSYLDVLIISSLIPSVFITSVELRDSFFLGALARFGGSLFVERRSPSGLKGEIEAVSVVLAQGHPVVLFPEGTTSNGDVVRQFKNSLFDAAVSSGAAVHPFCLRYTKIDGDAVTASNRDAVFYYGGMTFAAHLPGLLSLKSVEVDVIALGAIAAHAEISRKDLAAQTHDAISTAYRSGGNYDDE